jgi:hypothetical protein
VAAAASDRIGSDVRGESPIFQRIGSDVNASDMCVQRANSLLCLPRNANQKIYDLACPAKVRCGPFEYGFSDEIVRA